MLLKRIWAFCMAALTVFFVIACIPPVCEVSTVAQSSDNPLPLSLAAPLGEKMYFLPPYDETANFTPAKKLYDLPVLFEFDEVREVSASFAEDEVFSQFTDLCCIESITPRAP